MTALGGLLTAAGIGIVSILCGIIGDSFAVLALTVTDSFALGFFGVSRMWRQIAELNNLDDPFDLRPGSLLKMPNV